MSEVTVEEFRTWAGAQIPANVGDGLIQGCLDEAESGIIADCDSTVAEIRRNQHALATFIGEELRRANRLLARRNSPEGVAGLGESGVITIPTRDADSQRAVWTIRAHLLVPEGVS